MGISKLKALLIKGYTWQFQLIKNLIAKMITPKNPFYPVIIAGYNIGKYPTQGGMKMAKQATKWKLAETLKTMMLTTSVDHITIEMLTKKAKLTRNTFYYHFDDIYSLLEWIYKQELLANIEAYTKIEDWKIAYRLILDYIEDNQQFCLETFRSVARDLLENFLYSVASDLVKKVIVHSQLTVSPKLQKSITNFYGWALVMQVVQWLANGLKEPKGAVVLRAEIMLTGGIENAIQNGRQFPNFGQS